MARPAGGLIAAVEPGSVGDDLGLEPGDRLIAVNGHTLRDVIDYRFYAAEEELVLLVERAGVVHRLQVERDFDEDLGLDFADALFDGLRECDNRCPFCFVDQMPAGLRGSLYLHDDDYRYSFLDGSFVTLTNLSEEDWQRLAEQRLSPLFVSIHATDAAVRRRVLGNPAAPDIMAQLRRLAALGINVHGQLVLTPGLNDGAVLERSIEELLGLWPTVQTLALVPVGLTRFCQDTLRRLTPDEARQALAIAQQFAGPARKRTRATWLYPSDELYLLAAAPQRSGQPVPAARFYDDRAQRENGVGLVRELLDDWEEVQRDLGPLVWGARPARLRQITLACGALIAPTLAAMAAEFTALTGIAAQVAPVANRTFGETVTVSGLLTGADVVAALAGRALGEWVILPAVMFRGQGERTLDDMTVADLERALGTPIALAETWSDILAALPEADPG